MIPKTKEGWAAALVAMVLQGCMILAIATPQGVQGWALLAGAIVVAGIAPEKVLSAAQKRLGGKIKKGDLE